MNDMLSLLILRSHHVADGVSADEFDFTNSGVWVAPFKAAIILIAPGCSAPADQHDVRECWITISGCGQVWRDDDVMQLKPRSAVYFDSQQKHLVRNDGDVPLVIFSIWWKP